MKIRLGRFPTHFYIFVSCLAVFLFSLQRNFSAAHDSITYLNNISSGKNLFHPHHLLYNVTARYWLVIWQQIFPSAQDYILIEILSAVFGSACIATCYLFFTRRAKLSQLSGSIACTVIAFSYGTWSYSSNIEVYAPPLFFSLLVLYRITDPALNKRQVPVIALYTILAILFHQVHVLLIPVVTLLLYKKFRDNNFPRVATIYLVPVFMLTAAIYLLVAFYAEGINNFEAFFSWVTLYAHGHDYWRAPAISSLVLAATGFIHAFFGGHFIFKLPIESLTGKVLSQHNLADEKFLVRSLTTWQSWVLLLFMLIALALMLKLVLNYFKSRGYKDALLSPVVYTLIVYSCFFFFWMPENLEFWILQSILFWILLFSNVLAVSPSSRRIRQTIMIAVCLFLVNYAGSIFWLQNKDNDWYYSAVRPLIPVATCKDRIVARDPWIMDDYVRRFIVCSEPLLMDEELKTGIERTLANHARVFVINAQDSNSVQAKLVDSALSNLSSRITVFETKEPSIFMIR